MDAQKARRDSLLQRNMLLSMRLDSGQSRHVSGSGTRKALGGTRTAENGVAKTWRMSYSPQRTVSKNSSPPKAIWNRPAATRKTGSERSLIPSPVRPNPITKQVPSLDLKSLSLDDFEIGKKLGKGKFGRVYCVKHKKTGFICAMKAMEKSEIVQHNVQKQFRREVEIQSSLTHPNLTKLYGFFHDDKRVYLLMEYLVNGELYKVLKTKGPFNDIVASHYVYQMADALDFMHQRNIIHRDVKPENILMGFGNVVKLTDFGWSIINARGIKRKTLCGTPDYLSPELLKSREYDDKVDVWALGVLAYELVVNRPPFEEDSKNSTYKRIVSGDLKFPDTVSSDAQDLIKRLLRHEAKDRIALQDVKRHPWILKHESFW